jgi:hypothetical protein
MPNLQKIERNLQIPGHSSPFFNPSPEVGLTFESFQPLISQIETDFQESHLLKFFFISAICVICGQICFVCISTSEIGFKAACGPQARWEPSKTDHPSLSRSFAVQRLSGCAGAASRVALPGL